MASKLMLRNFRSYSKLQVLVPNFKKAQITKVLSVNNSLAARTFSTSILRNSNVMKDLSNFLNEEIKLEQEAQKELKNTLTVTGFNVKTDGPNVTLTKKYNDEEITVKFNINGSLDNAEPGVDQVENKIQSNEVKTKSIF